MTRDLEGASGVVGDSRVRAQADVSPRRPQRGEMQSRNLEVVAMIVQSSVCPEC